jgi:1-aminocyclopropane-1-carboxylate deaminase/D-cysteine desulfhydrase-like pyridoxal-dependent ACC family enzyme
MTSIERLLATPRLSLGQWPTPIESRTHRSLGRVLVKRDDMAGFGDDRRSGVKARKLEAFLAYLQARNVEMLIMPLGNITNLGGDLAQVARGIGLDLHFLIANDPPLPPEMRIRLFKGLERETRLFGTSSVGITMQLCLAWARARLSGRKAFAVLPSPGHPSAVLGMACGYLEMARQIRETGGAMPRAVYIAAAAGSSVAGLALAEALMRLEGSPPVRIVAVQVTPYPLRIILPVLLRWTRHFLRLRPLDFSTLSVVADPRNTGYGRFDSKHISVCERLEYELGLLVDPIYGAKTWSTMEELEAHTSETQRPPMFWHCGYTPYWRTYSASPERAATDGCC